MLSEWDWMGNEAKLEIPSKGWFQTSHLNCVRNCIRFGMKHVDSCRMISQWDRIVLPFSDHETLNVLAARWSMKCELALTANCFILSSWFPGRKMPRTILLAGTTPLGRKSSTLCWIAFVNSLTTAQERLFSFSFLFGACEPARFSTVSYINNQTGKQ